MPASRVTISRLREQLDRNDRMYEEEKQERIQRAESGRKVWTREDISESDLEHVLCSAIPVDQHGNLTPAKKSTLYNQFAGKRFSRKRINDVLRRKTDVERFDLITLNFLIHAELVDQEPNARKRYIRFIESTNRSHASSVGIPTASDAKKKSEKSTIHYLTLWGGFLC